MTLKTRNKTTTIDKMSNNHYVSPESLKNDQQTQPFNDHSPLEIDGPKGPEPTRYGDWEKKGRCIDF